MSSDRPETAVDPAEEVRADILEARTEVAAAADQLAERLNPKKQARRAATTAVTSARRAASGAGRSTRHFVHRVRPSDDGVLIGPGGLRRAAPLAVAGIATAVVIFVRRRRGH